MTKTGLDLVPQPKKSSYSRTQGFQEKVSEKHTSEAAALASGWAWAVLGYEFEGTPSAIRAATK
jgi:hypothetical protein